MLETNLARSDHQCPRRVWRRVVGTGNVWEAPPRHRPGESRAEQYVRTRRECSGRVKIFQFETGCGLADGCDDLIREGTISGGDTNDWDVVEASRVGHTGGRQLALLGFADNYCVNLEMLRGLASSYGSAECSPAPWSVYYKQRLQSWLDLNPWSALNHTS